MIAALRGRLQYRGEDHVVVDVNGVGYLVTVSSSALATPKTVGSEISLVIFTDVKENAISLFGFVTPAEREVFLLLRKVKGIGSKLSMAILSAVGAESLLGAIGRGDIDALHRVPGIGKKTAERIIVELREQVGEIPQGERGTSANLRSDAASDAVLALEKLGFASERARGAVSGVLERSGGKFPDAGELVRLSLAQL